MMYIRGCGKCLLGLGFTLLLSPSKAFIVFPSIAHIKEGSGDLPGEM